MARHSRRLILWIIGSLLALALLVAIGVVVFVSRVDPNVFRGRIEAAASQALGRSVRLSGNLHWHLGASIAIESRGGEIANVAGFEGPLASWRVLRLAVAARPLLNRDLQIDHIDIEGLSLQLQRDAAGRNNWSFTQARPAVADASQMQWRIGSVALRDASVRFSDAAAGRHLQLDSMSLEAGLPEDWRAPMLNFRDLVLRARVSGVPVAAPGVEMALSIPGAQVTPGEAALSVAAWQLQWDATHANGSVQARGGAMPIAEGEIKVETASLRRLLQTVAVNLPPTRDPKAYGAMRLNAGWNYHDGSAALNALDLTLDAAHVQGSVTLPRLSPLSLRFELAADRVDVDRYLEPEDANSEPFELPLAQLKALDARGVLRIGQASVAGAAAKELTIDVD